MQSVVAPGPNHETGPLILPSDERLLSNASFAPAQKLQKEGNAPGKMQASRFEYKYLITERQADRIRGQILLYLDPDEFTVGRLGKGYLVNSLYLDSPSMKTFWDTEQGAANRFKIRIRFYDDKPDSPAFLEVKRRRNEVIYKTRAMVTKDSINRYIKWDVLPSENDLYKVDRSHLKGLYNFNALCSRFMARPAAYTSYFREGFEPKEGNYDRVTFDRDLRTGPITDRLTIEGREDWTRIQMGPWRDSLVFEMKFTDVYPLWMQYLAEKHNLVREAYQKYGSSMKVMQPRYAHLAPPFKLVRDS